jgi:hypothetical protein
MESFGASEAVKDIFTLFIRVAYHYVFPAHSFLGQVFGLFICIMRLVEGSVRTGVFFSLWHAFVWAACLPGLSSLPLASFLSLGVFFLFKFGRVSSFCLPLRQLRPSLSSKPCKTFQYASQ